jgi:uroporphyrinogen decarboxylase
MEELMMDYHGNRPFFDELLGIFQREMMDEVRAALKAGVRHLFANWYYNSMSAGWSPAIWKEVFAPHLKEMTSAVHAAGGTVNFYDDGKCMPIVELLADCGIDVLQTLTPPPVGDVDLAEVKKRIGRRVCLMGYVDLLYVIQRGTPELIDRTVHEAIETAGPTGFILGTSDSIRDGTPVENVHAYFDAARKYGTVIK